MNIGLWFPGVSRGTTRRFVGGTPSRAPWPALCAGLLSLPLSFPLSLPAGSALLWASPARADEPTDTVRPTVAAQAPPSHVEEIVVTAGRRPLPRRLVGASISVVDALTLEADQSRDLLEVLRDVPSFSVVQTGSRGGTTSLFVRGGEADHNLVLVDGVQVNRGGGSFDFSNLSTDGVERVEVIRGPAAALYGSDAVSSVIHVITKRGEGPPSGSVRALVGSDRTHELAANLSGGGERFGYSLSAGRYATDGLDSLNNDSDNSTFRGRLDLDPGERLSLSLASSYTMSSFDFPTDFVEGVRGGFPAVDPDQGRDTFEWYNGLTTTFEPSDGVEHKLVLGYTRSRFDNFDGLDPIPSDSSERKSRQHEQRRIVDYQLALEGPRLGRLDSDLVVGAEYERETFESSTLAPKPRSSFTQQRRNRAAFAQVGLDYADQVLLTLSARFDDNSEFGTFLTPAASIAWFIPQTRTKLRASFSKGFKEPAFRENFGTPGGTTIGNPDLDPELSRGFEVGLEQELGEGRGSLGITYFRTDFDDLISSVGPGVGGGINTFLNIQGARTQGIEATLELELTEWARLSTHYTLLRTRVLDSGGVGGTAFVEGDELLRRPTHSGSIALDLGDDGWSVRLASTFVGPRTDRDFGFVSSGERVRSEDYLKTDLSASYRLYSTAAGSETWGLLRVENLFDEDYEEAFGFEAPGRRFLAGLELRRP